MIGRALRQRAAADALERRAAGADLARLRVLDREFAERAIRERGARFPTLTAQNAGEAIRFQEERIEAFRAESVEYQAALARVEAAGR